MEVKTHSLLLGRNAQPTTSLSERFASSHLSVFASGKRTAFTLAEVLITLAIIGVVAAITIPTLISKYQEKATVTKVKKFYSDFSQAYKMAVLENGPVSQWGLTNSSKDTNEETGISYANDASLENYDTFFNKIKPYLKYIKYEKIKINKTNGDFSGGLFLPDGTVIFHFWLYPELERCKTQNGTCGDFTINTDGNDGDFDKNAFGFYLYNDHIEPAGIGTTKNLFSNCKNGKSSHCTGWVISNGNMDYLHCPDELDWNTKTKCD